jgi:hypothetical protein
MGLEVEQAKGGCCGLAGSWGFEEGKYDISRQCGEVGFLPAVRKADPETYIVADGFSCKTQLEQSGIGRQALHTAEVMKIAREHHRPGGQPERYKSARPAPPTYIRVGRTAAVIGLAAAGFALTRKVVKALRADR